MTYKFLDEHTESTIVTAFGLNGLHAGWHSLPNPETSNVESILVDYIWIVNVRDLYHRGFILAGVYSKYTHSGLSSNRSLLIMPPLLQSDESTALSLNPLRVVELGDFDPIANALTCIPLINQLEYVDYETYAPNFRVMTFTQTGNSFFHFYSQIIDSKVLSLWNVIWETTQKLVDSVGDKDIKESYHQHYNNFPHRIM